MGIRSEWHATARTRVAASAVALALVLSGPLAATTFAQTAQELFVYVAACPVDYVGDDYVEACYATPAANFLLDVRVDDPATIDPPVGTGDDGIATFDITGFAPGTVRIVTNGPDGATSPYRLPAADCTADGTPLAVTFPETQAVGPVIDIEVPSPGDVRCDLYFVPIGSGATGDGDDRDTGAAGDVSATTTLPSTGVSLRPSGGADLWLLGLGLLLFCGGRIRYGRRGGR